MKAARRQKTQQSGPDSSGVGSPDLLTELPNRRRFTEHLNQAVAKGHCMPFGLIVETRGIWQKLATLNCDAAQGYLMCPPRPAAALNDWLVHVPWRIGKISTKKKRATPRLGQTRTTVK